jgi:hypothetical protein
LGNLKENLSTTFKNLRDLHASKSDNPMIVCHQAERELGPIICDSVLNLLKEVMECEINSDVDRVAN